MADDSPKKVRDDQIFNIITGYYPEIASDVKYMAGKKGKGQVGVKFRRKRGFSNQTIERDRTKSLPDEGPFGPTKETVVGMEGTSQEGQNLYKRKVGVKDDPDKIWYKFTGGGDMYKIYGDMSWYMHGVRVKDTITDYVNSVSPESQNSPAFGQIYSNMEGKLAQEALQMARDIFATTIEDIDESLEKADFTGQMSAEEMGYKSGDFEYLSKGEILSRIKQGIIKDPQGELAAQLTKVEGSMANPRDLYRLRVIGESRIIELMQDVSERDIQDLYQHGITEIPQDLKDAIEEIKAGPNAQNISALRKAVAEMYTSAIKDEYNPMIRAAKVSGKYVKKSPSKQGSGPKKWKKVLKEIGKNKKNEGATSVGVSQIGKVLGISTEKAHFMDKTKERSAQTALELISHTLGTMNDATTASFRTSHRVHTYPSGQSIYATANITPDPNTLLFNEDVKPDNIGIVEGYSLSTAQEKLNNHRTSQSGLEVVKTQKHNYSASKVTGIAAAGTSVSSCTATLGVAKGLRNTTAVHIPAKDELEQKLIELLVDGIPDISSLLDSKENPGGKLQKRMYGLGKNRKLRKGFTNFNRGQFWALPYIGVSQSEYIEK